MQVVVAQSVGHNMACPYCRKKWPLGFPTELFEFHESHSSALADVLSPEQECDLCKQPEQECCRDSDDMNSMS